MPLTIDDFDTVCERTPVLADLKPGGRFAAADLDRAGGTKLVASWLIAAGKMDGSQRTPSGRTLAEECATAVEEPGLGDIQHRRLVLICHLVFEIVLRH